MNDKIINPKTGRFMRNMARIYFSDNIAFNLTVPNMLFFTSFAAVPKMEPTRSFPPGSDTSSRSNVGGEPSTGLTSERYIIILNTRPQFVMSTYRDRDIPVYTYQKMTILPYLSLHSLTQHTFAYND